jgi:hypothetical protein
VPLATLLTWSAAFCGIALIARQLSKQPLRRRTLIILAVTVGLICSAASTVKYAERSAGTGTYGTWGWPRAVYTRWVSWEIPTERHGGFQLRGLIENAILYGAAAAALVSLSGGRFQRGRITTQINPPSKTTIGRNQA